MNVEIILSPTGPVGVAMAPPAPRPATLAGKRIAFLWDNVFRGDEMFPVLQQEIAARFEGAEFVGYDAFGSTFGGEEEAVLAALPDRLREHQVDAVISGVGC